MKETLFNIRVIPNASRNSISTMEDETVKVKLTCAPVDGKANKALIALLAKEYNVSKSSIEIVRGHTSKDKIIKINR
jgi:uncharacterized protein (TIGR00251 family)